ncbi:MAG: VWA domain-containing protein [Halieaceae bacterium]|jgi:Ca-activated chloride channel homolog|nr:VWA domain-containing protein [Halieaceae bacterium]
MNKSLLVVVLYIAPIFCGIALGNDKKSDIPTVVLFDRSFSMTETLNGSPKIDIAKTAFREMAHRFHGHSNVGVRFFAGGRNPQNDSENCLATELSLPLGERVSTNSMNALISGLRPLGRKTNLAFALEQARSDLASFAHGKIILISDGEENCELDPIGLAQTLAMENIDIDTIGIGQPGQFSQLGRIALAGSGKFQLADSAGTLAAAMGLSLPAAIGAGTPGGMGAGNMPGLAAGAAPQSSGPVATPAAISGSPALPVDPVRPLTLEIDVVSEKPEQAVAIEVILDVSGSMAGMLQGQRKIALARTALQEALRGLDSPAFIVGFRAYGFDSSLEKTAEASCPNTELLNAIAPNQVTSIRSKIEPLSPFGYTPIARSLELAGQDLLQTGQPKQMIILISDGEETCGGDPVAVAEKLRAMGIDIETHVIGFDLEQEQAQQMRDVASAGAGKYYDARDAKALKSALLNIVDLARDKIDPTWLRTIHPIEGGATAATAVELMPGTYTLTHYLDKDTPMYFRVGTQIGQYGVIRGLIQSRRLIRDGSDMVESTQGYSQYRISLVEMKGDKNRGRFVRLSGEPGSYGHVGYSDTAGDGFLFTISSGYDRVHKDALFNVDILEAGDRFQRHDAPEAIDMNSLPISVNDVIMGHLGDGDVIDTYKIAVPERDQSLLINIAPTDPLFRYRVTLKTAQGRRIISRASRGGPVQVPFEQPSNSSSPVFLIIESNNPGLKSRFTPYTIDIKGK